MDMLCEGRLPTGGYMVQNSSGNTLFTKAMRNVVMRRTPVSLRSSRGSPLHASAENRRGHHRAGLITSNGGVGEAEVIEARWLYSTARSLVDAKR